MKGGLSALSWKRSASDGDKLWGTSLLGISTSIQYKDDLSAIHFGLDNGRAHDLLMSLHCCHSGSVKEKENLASAQG